MREKYVIKTLSDIMEQGTKFSKVFRNFRFAKTGKKRRNLRGVNKDVRMERALEFMAKLQSTANKPKNRKK